MSEIKVFEKDEILSDNTSIKTFEQCRNCKKRSDGTVWSSAYNKASCSVYVYPHLKPQGVMYGEVNCPYREEEE